MEGNGVWSEKHSCRGLEVTCQFVDVVDAHCVDYGGCELEGEDEDYGR